jgi:hypothetical protein
MVPYRLLQVMGYLLYVSFPLSCLLLLTQSKDEGAIVFILAGLETNLAIMCGSLPGCKPLLARACPKYFGTFNTSAEYSYLDRSRWLPGARFSIRLSRGEPAHLPPASRIGKVDRSIVEIQDIQRPKSLSRSLSVESVPVKLDTRYYETVHHTVMLSPLQEVYSPSVSERMIEHGQELQSPARSAFVPSPIRSEHRVPRSAMRSELLLNIPSPTKSVGFAIDSPTKSEGVPDSPTFSEHGEEVHLTPPIHSPTVSERMDERGATSWYHDNETDERSSDEPAHSTKSKSTHSKSTH